MSVSIESLNRSFFKSQQEIQALKNVHLHINKGEFITIIGPSGCGKSTLLKIIAGLDLNFEGRVKIGDDELKGPGIKQGFIF
jgi:sulfonate transport system ATP-binding protein